ncbi:hypothetical protein HYW76_01740 [Candidatus Pacearchaeota archaeon]|nr:hypothetical protein [Candidatus Pacearchaeota archaeon]
MKIDGDMAELLGIHIGDGCISVNKRYSMYYLGGDINEEKEYHDVWVSKLLNKKVLFPLNKKQAHYKEYYSTGVYGVYIFDKEVVSFFKKFGILSGSKKEQDIPKEILRKKYLIKRFTRGLFDTDGSIYFDKNRSCKNPINNVPLIKLGITSKRLVKSVFNSLKLLGFNPRMKKPYKGKKDKNKVYSILIYRKKDITNYIKNIGFKNSKHTTKWLVFQKQGYLQPNTCLKERLKILGFR